MNLEIMCILQSLDLVFCIHLSDQISHGMSLLKAIWHYVAKLQMHLPSHPAIPLQGICPGAIAAHA